MGWLVIVVKACVLVKRFGRWPGGLLANVPYFLAAGSSGKAGPNEGSRIFILLKIIIFYDNKLNCKRRFFNQRENINQITEPQKKRKG